MYDVFSDPIFKWAGLIAATLLFFLSIYILSDIKKKETLRIVLFFLTIAASAQTFFLLFHHQISSVFRSTILGIPTLFGPLAFFYIQNYVSRNNRHQFTDLLSFLPFLLVSALPLIPHFHYEDYPILVLMIVVIHWGLFLIFCGIWIYNNRKNISGLKPFESKWILTFFALNVFIWIFHSLLYIIGAPFQLVYATSIFCLAAILIFFYFKFRSDQLTLKTKPVKTGTAKNASKEYSHIYLNKLEHLLWDNKIYLDPNLTIPKLAEKMQIQPYLLSQIINSHFNQSFPDFINTYRINEAKTLLTDDNLKISSIASDCGFNTLSSFNIAFKKATKQTPSEYRTEIMNG